MVVKILFDGQCGEKMSLACDSVFAT